MENNNGLIKHNIFGLNITVPKKTIAEVAKVAKQEAKNMSVNPFIEYFEENDKVFSDQVAKEIRSCQSQIYALGQIMREGQVQSTFNIKV